MRFLLLVSSMLAGIVAYAQNHEYKPILKDGRVWKTVMPSDCKRDPLGNEFPDMHFTYSVCGDTIVYGRVCKKISFHCETEPPKDFPVSTKDETIAAYERDGKLYASPGKDTDGILMIDMTLHANDVVNEYASVTKEDDIEVRGVTYHRLSLASVSGELNWVEGIGSSQNFFATHVVGGYTYTSHYNDMFMAACYDNGLLVFSRDDFDADPLPASITTAVMADKDGGPIYNTVGQRVSVPKEGAIYIQNGKKRIMR